jgi:hypothetical protein
MCRVTFIVGVAIDDQGWPFCRYHAASLGFFSGPCSVVYTCDDACVPFGAIAQYSQCRLVRLALIRSESLLETRKFNHDSPLFQTRFERDNLAASRQESSACCAH